MLEYTVCTSKPFCQEELDELFKFYNVSDLFALVFIQARQIERLQEKLSEYEIRYPSKTRFA
jgi:hypothetical protein